MSAESDFLKDIAAALEDDSIGSFKMRFEKVGDVAFFNIEVVKGDEDSEVENE